MDKPKFSFALTKIVLDNCPSSLDGKEIQSSDFLPTQAREKDTGYDVRCAVPGGLKLSAGCYFKMPLGFRMFAPEGWWLKLVPRSGTFVKNHIQSLYGTIDESYENELCFAGLYIPDRCSLTSPQTDVVIPFGQRVAQVIPVPRYEMEVNHAFNDELDEMFKKRNASRGTGGFGSSGVA